MPSASDRQNLALALKAAARAAGLFDTTFSDATIAGMVGQDSTEAEMFTTDAGATVLFHLPMAVGTARFIRLDVIVTQGDTGEIYMQRDLKLRRTTTGTTSSVFRTVVEDWSDGIAKDSVVLSLTDNASSVDVTATGIAATNLHWKARATVLASS